MQYYQFHLGDYISHTAHLEPLEDLAYRRLLDLYYSTEQPIPNDIQSVSRRLRLGSDVVEIVLNEFFDLSDGVWHNHRCDVEISKFNEWINKQKANGRKGGRPRKQPQNKPRKTHGKPIANPSPTDRKPIVKPPTTHNPLPITHNPTKPNLNRWNLKPLARRLRQLRSADTRRIQRPCRRPQSMECVCTRQNLSYSMCGGSRSTGLAPHRLA